VLHPQLNGSGHTVTYRPSRLRAGTLGLIFASPAHAWAAIALLRTAYTFTLTADVTEASMTFVVAPGQLAPRHAEKGTPVWVVEVPVQEVAP
jgi:hypothetical protein